VGEPAVLPAPKGSWPRCNVNYPVPLPERQGSRHGHWGAGEARRESAGYDAGQEGPVHYGRGR